MNTGVISVYCRILLTQDMFAKTGANWSKEMYRIARYNPNNNRYYLEGITGAFNRDELQPINRESQGKTKFKSYKINILNDT